MVAPRNPYAVLGVTAEADDVVIRAAYKALLRKHHPDLNPAADAADRTQALNEAFALIGTPERRARFDRDRAAGAAPRPPGPPPPRPQRPPPRPQQPLRQRADRFAIGLAMLRRRLSTPRGRAMLALVAGVLLLIPFAAHALLQPDSPVGNALRDRANEVAVGLGLVGDPALVTRPDGPPQPAVDPGTMLDAADRARHMILQHNLPGAEAFSHACGSAPGRQRWRTADYCVAFDVGAQVASAASGEPETANDIYFRLAVEGAEARYDRLGLGTDVAARLASIRDAVTDHTLQRMDPLAAPPAPVAAPSPSPSAEHVALDPPRHQHHYHHYYWFRSRGHGRHDWAGSSAR